MKRLLFLCLWLCTAAVHAAVPTFQSFEPTQFLTNNNRIAYIATHTNDAGVIYPALANDLTLVTNLNSYGTFSLPAKVTLLTTGTNYLDVSTNSTWLLNSPTNDATQVILSLSAGAYQGQLTFITSQNGGNSFTLPDLSEQWDVPGAFVDIQGDWIGTTNRGIILQYTAPDWIEMARFDPAQSGGGSVLGSGIAGYFPYWLNSGTLSSNSPLLRLSTTSIGITTPTNILYASNGDLHYTNSSGPTPGVAFQLHDGLGNGGGIKIAGNVTELRPYGSGVGVQLSDISANGIRYAGNVFQPLQTGTDLSQGGAASTSWRDFAQTGKHYFDIASSNVFITKVTGSPEGMLVGSPGSVALSATGDIYKKATGTGNTGWTALGAGGGTTINPTDGFIPYRVNATTFVDSLLSQTSTNMTLRGGGSGQLLGIYNGTTNHFEVKTGSKPSFALFDSLGDALRFESEAGGGTWEIQRFGTQELLFRNTTSGNGTLILLNDDVVTGLAFTNINRTEGFAWLPATDGAPTNTPSFLPLFSVPEGIFAPVYDNRNSALWVYNGLKSQWELVSGGGGSALWASSGGVLSPSPAVGVVSVQTNSAGYANFFDDGTAYFKSRTWNPYTGPNIDAITFDITYDSTDYSDQPASLLVMLGATGSDNGSAGGFSAAGYFTTFVDRPNDTSPIALNGSIPLSDFAIIAEGGSSGAWSSGVLGMGVGGTSRMGVVGIARAGVVSIGVSGVADNFSNAATYPIGGFFEIVNDRSENTFWVPSVILLENRGTTNDFLNAQSSGTNKFRFDQFGRLNLQGKTNLIGDSGTALTYNGVAIGGGAPIGTMVASGISTQYRVPRASDTTGTNYGPSGLVGDGTSTNMMNLGVFAAHSGVFTNGISFGNGIHLLDDAANILALRNSTSAQSYTIYNTYTSGTSYERMLLGFVGDNVGYVLTQKGSGGGTSRPLTIGTSSDSALNFYVNGANRWLVSTSGGNYDFLPSTDNVSDIGFSATVQRPRTIYFGTSLVAPNGSVLSDDAAGRWQMGLDAAAPVSPQILGVADGSGTDKNGSDFQLSGGRGTGTGRGGALIGKTSLTTTTGSSAQTESTRYYHSAKFVDLTESTATLFCNIALASSKYVGVRLNCTVSAADATDFQAVNSNVSFAAVNKAGTVTVGAVTQNDDATAASTGTLTVTFTAVANGAGIDIKANAVSSLTQTSLRCKWMITSLNSDDTAVVTPQ